VIGEPGETDPKPAITAAQPYPPDFRRVLRGPHLTEATTVAGVRVEVRWHGERRAFPPDIDLSAFRSLQEAITNVVRHAGTQSCRVSIEWRGEELAIDVVDDGRGHGDTVQTGYGLVGMRERATLLGGEFTAGPAARGRLPGDGPPPPTRRSQMIARVLVADDQPLVHHPEDGDHDAPDIEVVGEAGTGAEAVRLGEDLCPDVVVMDIRMPGMDGIEATRLITEGASGACVVVLTTFDDDDYVYGALRAGASGFLVKDMALDDILGAIRFVAAGTL
jgi:CheY-like chemotaxis protein